MKLACHYSPLVRKKRVRRSIIDKLEERLESMEQMLQPLVERLSPNDPVVLGAGGFALGFGFAPAPPPAISHPLGLPAHHQNQYQVQPHAFYAPQIQQQQQQQQPPPMLPPVHVIEELMDIAFTRMTPTAPPVSWAGLVRRLHSGQLPEYIVCATVALAARFSNRPEFICTPRYNAGREYARRAAELIAGLVDRPDPDVVFCLVMLSLYEWGCGRGESAWTYTGMATRLAQRCRLHLIDEEDFNENADGQDRSWASTEWRRRLWWHVYCGDRTSVIVASRPATVHDDDCVVNLPTHDHEWVTGTLPDDSSSASLKGASNKIPDSWWIVVELYGSCSRISEFVNRRRRAQRSSDIPRRAMFDILDRELEDIRSRFVPCMSEFPPQDEWLVSGYTKLTTGVGCGGGVSNIWAIYFNIHLMYHAAKIILYRSELPEYQHESISPELIQRAKRVCTESAHQQAEVIRWALDSIPIEDWDPKVGVWSLQGASIHVNAALSDDNAVAEQSRRDLEVHLKLHVASDQYYHFNMAIITMLHHVFNLRKRQRLAIASSSNNVVREKSPSPSSSSSLVIYHENDSDPWIVPRCSSFLGFTYNYSQLRGILNDAIKQTTYGPPDTSGSNDHQLASLPAPNSGTVGYPSLPLNIAGGALMTHQPIYSGSGSGSGSGGSGSGGGGNTVSAFDLSGGLWHHHPPGGIGSMVSSYSPTTPIAVSAVAAMDETSSSVPPRMGKRALSSSKPPAAKASVAGSTVRGGRKNISPPTTTTTSQTLPVQPAGTQQIEKLQRLEELRARVVLLQQLSQQSPGPQGGFTGMFYGDDDEQWRRRRRRRQ
ncbi:hypothetical protein GGF42_005458 [Coemansia sp. RSA 2424]|nr:hypothetical protein GGF42_005458 [Coemansia sp. RSA 2424]